MKFRKLTALLLSASMAVGLLAGCGGTPSNTETGTPSTGTPSTGDPGTEATGSAASGESSLKGRASVSAWSSAPPPPAATPT